MPWLCPARVRRTCPTQSVRSTQHEQPCGEHRTAKPELSEAGSARRAEEQAEDHRDDNGLNGDDGVSRREQEIDQPAAVADPPLEPRRPGFGAEVIARVQHSSRSRDAATQAVTQSLLGGPGIRQHSIPRCRDRASRRRLEQYKPYLADSDTVVCSPHKGYGPEPNDLVLQLRKRDISQVLLAGMSANLCLESHLRDLLEQGFELAVVSDATAAAQHPDMGDGYAPG
jgi:hypothetical protein